MPRLFILPPPSFNRDPQGSAWYRRRSRALPSGSRLNDLGLGLVLFLATIIPGVCLAQEKSKEPKRAVSPVVDTPPRSLDPRIKIELFAEAPQIVTPTGIDVDHRGRVWAIESNTHFRPAEYTGHPSDRVLVMSDTDHDGKADRIITFADGLTFTMSVAVVKPWQDIAFSNQQSAVSKTDPKSKIQNPKLSAYIATRREIFLMHDDNGDDVADRKQSIVHLETQGNYPHNGLAGFAFDALGWMFFGFGENLGADYKIIGSDGTTLSGGGRRGKSLSLPARRFQTRTLGDRLLEPARQLLRRVRATLHRR